MSKTTESNWLQAKLHALMGPSLFILLGSSIFRGLLGLVIGSLASTYGTYQHWSPLVRLPIEIAVFLGVFITSDVCFAATVTNCEAEKRNMRGILNEEVPRFKGSADVVQGQTVNFEKNRAQRVQFAQHELATEKNARTFFGAVSIAYAINFVAQSIVVFNDLWNTIVLVAIELLSVLTVPYVIWYYSARYKATKADPVEKAESLMETGMEKRLEKAADHFEQGDPTNEDLNLADAALPARHHYKRFVAAMRKPPASDEIMTNNDIYQALDINDPNKERQIRRLVKEAYDRHVEGVYQIANGAKVEYRVDGKAFYQLFKKFLPGGQSMDKLRTYAPRQRPSRFASTGQSPENDPPATTVDPAPIPPADAADPVPIQLILPPLPVAG